MNRPLDEAAVEEVHEAAQGLRGGGGAAALERILNKVNFYSLRRFLRGVMQCPTLTRLLHYMSHFHPSLG